MGRTSPTLSIMAKNRCLVEIRTDGKIIRIFKNKHSLDFNRALLEDRIREFPREGAKDAIKRVILDEMPEKKCPECGREINWGNSDIHEKKLRSLGGEVSIFNSQVICRPCHRGPKGVHKDRVLFFGGKYD